MIDHDSIFVCPLCGGKFNNNKYITKCVECKKFIKSFGFIDIVIENLHFVLEEHFKKLYWKILGNASHGQYLFAQNEFDFLTVDILLLKCKEIYEKEKDCYLFL